MTDLQLLHRAFILTAIAIVGGMIGAVTSLYFPGNTIFGPLSAVTLGALVILAVRRKPQK